MARAMLDSRQERIRALMRMMDYEDSFFKEEQDDGVPDNVDMFWGGADVSPELYGEKNEGLSSCSPMQDELDLRLYDKAKKSGRVCAGICRGSQFLWAMSGGKLCQDIFPHHEQTHGVGGLGFRVNSYHHQGAFGEVPAGIKVLATHFGIVEAWEGTNKDGVKIFAVQWHPEMGHPSWPFASWFWERLKEFAK